MYRYETSQPVGFISESPPGFSLRQDARRRAGIETPETSS